MSDNLTALQIARETDMLTKGLERALRHDASATQRGEQTRVEKLTIEALVPPATAFLRELLASYGTKRPVWWTILSGLDLDEVSAAAIHTAFSVSLRNMKHGKAMVEFGQALEIIKVNAGLREKALTPRERRKAALLSKWADSVKGRRAVYLKASAATHAAWDIPTAIRYGEPLANAALATGLFEVVSENAGTHTETVRFALSQEGSALVREVEDIGMLARPVLQPMVVPPRPWEDLTSGAYLTETLSKRVPLVRTSTPEHLKLLKLGIDKGNMTGILRSVSAIQAVPLRINRAVYDLRAWAWDARLDLGDAFPLRDPVVVAERPDDIATWTPEARKAFWSNRAEAVRVNDGIAPNLIAWASNTAEATVLLDNTFYLPHNLDFRGRAYPVPVFSHHHGDATKALLEFANGAPLGPDGLNWLAVHLANCGDFDKVSKKPYAARIAWVSDNLEDLIFRTVYEPSVDLRWTKADAPFSFYAACVDYVQALESGDPDNYVSHLPIALDGSNSGVQHYSAAQRAEEGRFVNLTPEPEMQDLYGAVAKVVAATAKGIADAWAASVGSLEGQDFAGCLDNLNRQIEAIQATEKPGKEVKDNLQTLKAERDRIVAILWHLHGIGRSTVKRPVMTFGYSSEAFGMGQQIRADFMAPLSLEVLRGRRERHPFGSDNGRAAASWMGRQVYAGCVAVLPRVHAAMEWLKKTAEVLAVEQKGVLMVTPLGFPMLQKVTEWETKTVELHLLDRTIHISGMSNDKDRVVGTSVLRRIRANINVKPAKTVLKHKQASGVAPNVIHACDSTHLHMTVLGLVEAGVSDMLLIHDSFATHAGSVPVLNRVLRETFVTLYETWNPLEDVQKRALGVLSEEAQAALPPLPEKGSLDLSGVADAEFCFS